MCVCRIYGEIIIINRRVHIVISAIRILSFAPSSSVDLGGRGAPISHSSTPHPRPVFRYQLSSRSPARRFFPSARRCRCFFLFLFVVIYIIIIFRSVVSPITIIVRIESHLVHAGEGGPGYRTTNRIHYVRSPPNRLLCVRRSRAAHKTDDDVDSHDLPMTFARVRTHTRARADHVR